MAENLFKNSQCPIAPVDKLDFDFYVNCDITPAPEPTTALTCQPPLIIPKPSNDVGPSCPVIWADAKIKSGYVDPACDENKTSIKFCVTQRDVNPCIYQADLDIRVGIPAPPCPELKIGETILTTGFSDCLSPNATITIEKIEIPGDCSTGEPPICEFEFGLILSVPFPRIPCAIISAGNFEVTNAFSGQDYDEFNNPVDIACIVSPVTAFYVYSDDPNLEPSVLHYCVENPSINAWAADGVSLECPNCEENAGDDPNNQCQGVGEAVYGYLKTPQINWALSGTGVKKDSSVTGISTPVDPLGLALDFVKIDSGSGEKITPWNLSFAGADKITISTTPVTAYNGTVITFSPPPSKVGQFAELSVTDAATKENNFQITPRHVAGDCDSPGQCAFEIDLDILIRTPRTPCPLISVNKFQVDSGLALNNCFDDESENKFEITTTHKLPENCSDTGQCEFDVDLSIAIPIPVVPCPVIDTKFEFRSSFTGADADFACTDGRDTHFYITTNHIEPTCDNAGQCNFEVDLELFVPIPRIPCPIINRTSFAVSVGHEGFDCVAGATNVFNIVTRHTDPISCDDPGQCEFDVELSIAVPIPVAPCPVINLNTFDIDSGFTGTEVDELCKIARAEYTLPRIPESIAGYLANGNWKLYAQTPAGATYGHVDFNAQGNLVYTNGELVEYQRPGVIVNMDVTPFGEAEIFFQFEKEIGPVNRFTITTNHTEATCNETAQCEFDIELALFVTIPRTPCPNIDVRTFGVYSGYVGETLGCTLEKENKFAITTEHVLPVDCRDPGTCQFITDLEIVVPIPEPTCPIINQKFFEVTTTLVGTIGDTKSISDPDTACTTDKNNRFTITTSHTPATCDEAPRCEFDIELEVFVSIPRTPCPIIDIKNFEVTQGYAGEECVIDNKFEINTKHNAPADCRDTGQCEFEVTLELGIPIPRIPCAEISVKNFVATTGFSDTPCVAGKTPVFNITTVHRTGDGCADPGECKFEVELELYTAIPRTPCPDISRGVFVQDVFYENSCSRPASRFDITRQITKGGGCNEPDKCSYNVDLELYIPVPVPPCPIITNSTGMIVNIGYAGSACVAGKGNRFNIGTQVVQTPCGANTCVYDFETEITVPIPEPPCPDISRGDFKVNVGYANCVSSTQSFDIRKIITPAAGCDTPQTCQYVFDLEISVPIPPPTCPTISSSVSAAVRYADAASKLGGTSSTVVTNHTAPSCNDAGQCSFDIDTVIDLEIPRPPCPVITSTGSMRVGYNDVVSPSLRYDTIATNVTNAGTNSPPQCTFSNILNIDIGIPRPPCPSINISTTTNVLPLGSTPSASISSSANLRPGDFCDFNFELFLNIPESCYPTMQALPGTLLSGPQYSNFLTPVVHRTGPCAFTISTFALVKAITQCPVFSSSVAYSNVAGNSANNSYLPLSGASFSITPGGAAGGAECVYSLNGDISGTILYGGTGQVFAGGGGSAVGTTETKIVDNKIVTNINLTVGDCPPGGGGGGGGCIEGPQGATGPQGPPGPQGARGIPGAPGPMGMQGTQGAQGPQGLQGTNGTPGAVGPAGPRGIEGPQGAQGDDGEKGETGVTGVTGPEGPTGPQGCPGVAGPQGAAGPQGPSGIAGATGTKGDKGDTGAAGAQGTQGPTGPQGEQGPAGIQGLQGQAGAAGPQGDQGDVGAEGPVGATGPEGATGLSGPAGLQGATGPAGVTGATGPAGMAGPQGPEGLQGPQGIKGETGQTGVMGATGPQGPTGIGVTGPQGEQGPAGLAGPQGVPGVKGDKGDRGISGSRGAQGVQGAQGLRGERGLQGVAGVAGDQGATGVTGAIGATGIRGPAGPGGTRGQPGVQGPTGPRGATGPAPRVIATADPAIIRVGDRSGSFVELHSATGPTGPAPRVRSTLDPSIVEIIGGDDTIAALEAPLGATGATGPCGITGPAGPAGPAGPLPNSEQITATILNKLQSDATYAAAIREALGLT